ncbi:hypothetical protein [Ulvibacterium marinum]|uniref:Uncharacterized protein n=1 Tax=Ulvibacterium marinum TaxID=2419782 RepID=A0A3B0CBR8_9FLAO|nr:hypothetical protein [Ulvibacterium marinum]RKN83353.1 hypothetical protein D7Z94_05885 [Ulvibacterium marinum]
MDASVLDKLSEIENSKYLKVDNENSWESNKDTFIATSTFYFNDDTKEPCYRIEKHVRKSDNKLIWLDIEDFKTGKRLTTGI